MSGTTNALAQMFQAPQTIPEYGAKLGTRYDDRDGGMDCREQLYNEMMKVEYWATNGKTTIIITTNGKAVLENNKHKVTEIVLVDWHPTKYATRWQAWWNKSSMAHLGDTLRANADKRISMDDAFFFTTF